MDDAEPDLVGGPLQKQVEVWVEDRQLSVRFPFYRPLSTKLRPRLGGVWHRPTYRWTFPVSREAEVRAILLKTFGTDGLTPLETVDMVARVGPGGLNPCVQELFAFGTRVARRDGRDSPVTLYTGVRVLSGPDLPLSCGSRGNPLIAGPREVRELHIEAVPKTIALAAMRRSPGVYRLYTPSDTATVPMPTDPEPTRTREQLLSLRRRMGELLAEMDAVLATMAD